MNSHYVYSFLFAFLPLSSSTGRPPLKHSHWFPSNCVHHCFNLQKCSLTQCNPIMKFIKLDFMDKLINTWLDTHSDSPYIACHAWFEENYRLVWVILMSSEGFKVTGFKLKLVTFLLSISLAEVVVTHSLPLLFEVGFNMSTIQACSHDQVKLLHALRLPETASQPVFCTFWANENCV